MRKFKKNPRRLFWRKGDVQIASQQKRAKQKEYDGQDGATPIHAEAPLHNGPSPPPAAYDQKNTKRASNTAQQRMATANVFMAVFTALIFIINVVYAVFSSLQWGSIEGQRKK